MPSKSRDTFQENKSDLTQLMEFHQKKAGKAPGRKFNVEVLNKAAVVLVCAAWEAYCEDIVTEAIQHLVDDCRDPDKLPKALKSRIVKSLKEEVHDHALWRITGDGWRNELPKNADKVVQNMTGSWNTPKTAPIKELFDKALGIPNISKSWSWQKTHYTTAEKKLDKFVTLRCEIAHRQKAEDSVKKKNAIDFYKHAGLIADKIDEEVKKMLFDATGKEYW